MWGPMRWLTKKGNIDGAQSVEIYPGVHPMSTQPGAFVPTRTHQALMSASLSLGQFQKCQLPLKLAQMSKPTPIECITLVLIASAHHIGAMAEPS
jgi:hypothetical protein